MDQTLTLLKTLAGFQHHFAVHSRGARRETLPVDAQRVPQLFCPAAVTITMFMEPQQQMGGLTHIGFVREWAIEDIHEIRLLFKPRHTTRGVGWMTGFEPATARATTWCSAKLSYIHRRAERLAGFIRKSMPNEIFQYSEAEALEFSKCWKSHQLVSHALKTGVRGPRLRAACGCDAGGWSGGCR